MTVAAIAAACGGSDDTLTTSEAETAEVVAETSTPRPTRTQVSVPTSSPLPSATSLPTATALPLDAPTPAVIILEGAFTNSSRVTTVGIDEVFFGMQAAEAAEAASTEWVGEPNDDSDCYLVTPIDGPDRITLWVVNGRIEAVDIAHPEIRTPSKFGVGNTLEELQTQLGDRLTTTNNANGSVTATFTPTDDGDKDYRLIFEVVDNRVASYRAGRVGVVDRSSC